MLEYVNKLLSSQDNIIDQLKLLRENKHNKEVQKYIKALVKGHNSPYFKYCIDKYYFGKEVEEVEVPIRMLHPVYGMKGSKKVQLLLESEDNIIDQIKLLKKHKGTKIIDNYITEYLDFYANKYEEYCIKKYYYDMEVEEVKPTARSLNITLYKISLLTSLEKEEKDKKRNFKRVIKGAKEEDKVKILDGPFKGLIGIIKSFDIDNLKIYLTIELYSEKYDIEHEGKFKLLRKDNVNE